MGAVASKKCKVFAKNAVVHMVNGHSYAKALRAHQLSQAAIGLLIMECEENGFLSGSDVDSLRGIHNELIILSSSEEYLLSKVSHLLNAVSSAVKTLEEKIVKLNYGCSISRKFL
ncbi:hypothetical protein AVEN_23426-1 [Araneus ventricosus]|uniref:Uncharacterized protein n=1 Tax=Araneus ventricosus TaxID=182803 RepID=A0A4Y2E7Z6_ARAVE|nr:hypothetical protein AVEN_23426-1 [Araneus ventricosus]